MPEATALILAAGRGMRMGKRGEMTPKGLLEVGGEPLVLRSVRLLQEQGIRNVRIVTGHLADQYQDLFQNHAGVTLVHNAQYGETGSLLSLMTGLEGLDGDVVLLESDIIFERRALAPITSGVTRILMSGETRATDEVFIWSREGRQGQAVLKTMNKDISAQPEQHLGELVGITCFSAANRRVLQDVGAAHLAAHPTSDYEIVVVKTGARVDIDCHLIEDLAWSEVDDEQMYHNAISHVWPRICENDALYASGRRNTT